MPVSTNADIFSTSSGWFDAFKIEPVYIVTRHAQEASSYSKVAERFVSDLKELVDSEVFLLQQQIFNCNRMGLSWKRDTKENLHSRRGGINWAQSNQ